MKKVVGHLSAYFYDCERNGQVSFITTNLPNGRIRQVSTSGYDGLKRRIYKSVSSPAGGWHEYYYNGWNPVIERVQSSGGTTETVRYVWGKDLSGSLQGAGGVGGLLATQVGGAWYFPAYDANGNVTQYVDEDGHVVASYTYDAFGNTVTESGAVADAFPFRFSTKYYDSESGLYYYGYRFYSPKLGRWLTRDPIAEAGGVNLYAFCGNDGVGKVDVLGEKSLCDCIDISVYAVRKCVWDNLWHANYIKVSAPLGAHIEYYSRGHKGGMRIKHDDKILWMTVEYYPPFSSRYDVNVAIGDEECMRTYFYIDYK